MVSFTAIFTALAAASVVAAAPLEARTGEYQASYFYQGGNPGACGNYHSDSDLIVAMNHAQYSQGICGKKVKITNKSNGKSVIATVQDMCPGCGYGSIDLSVGTFNKIGNEATGILPISWNYV